MAEIIIPPQNVQVAANQEARQQQQVLQQIQQQIQQQILSLPNNTTIFSTVAGVDRNSNPVIRFAGLDLVLAVPILLSKGAQLSLRVDKASGSAQLQLISVDGKLPATQPQQVSGDLPNLAQPPTQQAQPLNIRILQAFPQNITAFKEEVQAAPRAETVVISSQQNLVTKGVVVLPNPEMMRAVKQNIAALSDDGKVPQDIEKMPDQIKAGTEIKFKILEISLPQQQPEDTQQILLKTLPEKSAAEAKITEQKITEPTTKLEVTPEGKVRLTAIVLGANNNDELLVQTRIGQVVIDNPLKGENSKLPQGAVINLEIENMDFPDLIPVPQNAQKTTLKTLSEEFPALTHLSKTEAGQEVLNKVAGLQDIPAARIIKFINAVKNNKPEDWLSDELLRQLDTETREKVAQQLRTDFQNLQKIMNEQGQSWQTIFFPIYDGEELHQLQLHVKRFSEDEGKDSGYSGTRFIVDLAAGTFGEMQFDGLVRKNVGSSNFDLIIRTHKNLDAKVKNDVTQIFNNAAEITGFKGGIDFSVMREFPNKLLGERLARDTNTSEHKSIDA